MPIDKRRLARLAETRTTAIGRLLLRARLDFVNRSVRILRERGVPEFPASFLTLLPHLDTEGTRSTELARRAAISKQAAGKTLRELEDAGLLERTPDERDGRAMIVRLTDKGLELLVETHRAVEQVEREYERLLGASTLGTLRNALQVLAGAASPSPEPPRRSRAPSPPPPRRPARARKARAK